MQGFWMLAFNATVDHTEARLALERVLSSRVFTRAERSRRFLRYLMDAALSQPPVTVKEFTIAMDVFDRDASYDPSIDATVRVEASRLRARLREYYDDEGRDETLIIEVPKGGYTAVLRTRQTSSPALPGQPVAAGQSASANQGQEDPRAPTPEAIMAAREVGPRRRPWIAACGFLLVLAGVAMGVRASRGRKPQGAIKPATLSLAILPIVNRTGDPKLDYLCDGLTDDLIRQLSQIPSLKLIARTAAFRYRQSTANPLEAGKALEAGRALKVGAVMTGELRRTTDHLSLVAELSDVADGTVLLDREYIVENQDLRSAQAELQRDLIAKLHVESSALDPGRSLRSVTVNPQAYQEFLQGDSLARSGEPGDLHQALSHFERAVSLDPQFDLAWSAIAGEHLLLGLYFEAPRDHIPQARLYAERALKINPSLGEAHGSLGLIHLVYDWKPAAAEAEMTAAGAEEAAMSTLSCTAHLIEGAGKPRAAEELLSRMLTYDPGSASLIAELGCVNYYRGDYSAALRHYRQALAADPRSPVPYWGIGKTLVAQHNYAEAITVLTTFKQKNGFEPPLLTAERGYALGSSGRRHDALAVVQELAERGKHSFIDPYFVAIIYASMNDREEAFAWLDKAFEARSTFMISLLSEPKWEPLRSDPRFQKLILRMLDSKAD
ncbi:tetratricopeptide repeat protein [Tunturiibacter empetritectus]|uniref:TolB-like protein/Tfp pilus assembly protein PilF n=1 Tax=Tunturiibacter lichenicola TaxID=2051959 RepID=A0A852V8I6_9BACT|nr:tetratricopeptide repeat protein [Edaphobacter lichenicola]NYF89288.1 TolB-like protein/Tfp pilus assembly protein PilF [Edaphobacter lichenicola]